MQFVIQELRPSSKPDQPRYYLRLEKDGVLKGWAVPKGLSERGDKQRLAIEVGPIKQEAVQFEGRLRKSQFGPGTIAIWDQGEYRFHSWTDDKIIFEISGSRVKGAFALIRFSKASPRHWLLEQNHSVPGTIPSPKKSPIVGITLERAASAHRNKPQPISIHREKPYSIYKKPPPKRRRAKRKGRLRFGKREKSPYSTGYTAHDWRLLATFVIIGLISLAILVILLNIR